MTSLGCNQDHSINRAGGGPYVFKVQGCVCHKIGSLIPREGTAPLHAQIYIYDPQEALDFRMNHQANAGFNRTDLVNRVFKAKVEALKADIFKNEIFTLSNA